MAVVNKIVIFSALMFALASGLLAKTASETVHVVSRGPHSLIVELQPFYLQGGSFKTESEVFHRVEIPGFGVFTEPGSPMLPQTGVVIQVPHGASVQAVVVEEGFEEVTDLQIAPAPEIEERLDSDRVSYRYEKNAAIYAADEFWPEERVEVTSRGRFRGRELVRVQINPVQYNPVTQVLRVYRTLRVEIAYEGGRPSPATDQPKSRKTERGLPSFILNADTGIAPALASGADVAPTAEWYDPQTTYYKIAVDETGIYKLSHDDLLTAGVPVQQANPEAIKIFNRGEEIPIWISGPDGGTWTPENAIYFYGERQRGDSTYYDFYSDTNIYWLTLDGAPGKRYQLVETGGQPFQQSAFYWETLHLEQENQFHQANRTSEIDGHEGWIWRYLFPDQQEMVPFESPALAQAAETCTLRVRIVGTTRDPASPDHHVRFEVNDQVVGDVYFDEEQAVIWQGTFSASLLRPQGNALKVMLLSDTGAEVNQIYLDWVEVVFPRSHVAQESHLRFEPGAEETDFFLSNFGDESVVVLDPAGANMWQPEVERQSLYRVESAGFDDGEFLSMYVDGSFFEFTQRGHGLLVLSPESGAVQMRSFDTFASAQASDEMAEFIDSLATGTVVLAGILDEGSAQMTEAAFQALESLGSTQTRQVGNRDSWALIGWKGAPSGSAAEVLSNRFAGPAVVSDTLSAAQAFRYTATFQDSRDMRSFYVAVSDSGTKRPTRIELDERSDLRNVTNSADYIIITHERFQSEAQQLANYRAQHNGLRTTVVDVQNIYDEFNHGVVHPQAIKDFLTVAYSQWQPPAPQFLVLLGDASWDSNQRMPESVKQNFVPSYGILVADNWLVSLDGPDDVLPDLFVGRLPVETREQAQMVIRKIMGYDGLPLNAWNKQFLFLNGGIDAVEQNIFKSQANILQSNHLTPPPFAASVTNFNRTNVEDAIDQAFIFRAADEIRKGKLWVNFLGHAGSAVWDINIAGPDVWQNETVFPFMTGMSCHSARFANPSRNSLAEDYFIHPHGASAYWGSSGFGYITQDFYLLDGLFKAVAKDTVRSLGEATTLAKVHVWQRLGDQIRNRGVIQQYALIGDPAMNLSVSKESELAVSAEDIAFAADHFLTGDSTTTLSVAIHNYGLMPSDSVAIAVATIGSEGESLFEQTLLRAPFAATDSLSIPWKVPALPGSYRVSVQIDPQNRIDETEKTDNRAEITVNVFASDLTLLKPLNFGVVQDAQVELLTNNSRISSQELTYFFEMDTSSQFNSAVLMRSPALSEGELVTRWQTDLPFPAVYTWRVRSFDGVNYGPWAQHSFVFEPSQASQWSQTDHEQFEGNELQEVVANSDGTAGLRQSSFVFNVESAGFVDGSHAYIVQNGTLLSPNLRGHNLAVFDESNLQVLSKTSFDTFVRPANSDSMAEYINSWPEGRIIVAAISDEGSFSMTEPAYLALERIGSQYTREVGGRDSWAIIGRKGAEKGSVLEEWKKSGTGPVVLVDTLYRFSKVGSIISPEVGPALQWHTLDVAQETPLNTEMAVQVLGRNAETGATDTLITNGTGMPVDLSGIDPRTYPKLRLQARLRSEDGVTTPILERWEVGYDPPPDLLVDHTSLIAERDTLVVGERLNVQTKIGNFGLVDSDSFSIRLSARANDGTTVDLFTSKTAGLAVDDLISQELQLDPGTDLSGRIVLSLEVDPDQAIPELNETNNHVTTPFWVVSDTVGPDVRITFDGVEVGLGEYVAKNPHIVVELRDRGQAAFADSNLVTVFLNGDKVPYGESQGQAKFIPQNTGRGGLKALVTFQPRLSGGDHEIEIVAKDESENIEVISTEFSVSESFAITDVMNYPNPFRDDTEFTYNLTQRADLVKLKIYTVSGRLIQELEFLPAGVGFNKFKWDGRDADHDILANGVYFYKIIARSGDQQVEVIEKLAVVR